MIFGNVGKDASGRLIAEVVNDDGEPLGMLVLALVPTPDDEPRGVGLGIFRAEDDDHGWAPSPPEGR